MFVCQGYLCGIDKTSNILIFYALKLFIIAIPWEDNGLNINLHRDSKSRYNNIMC